MATLDDKIRAFLQEAGYACNDTTSTTLQLIRFFEQEYDCAILGFLALEWWAEQVQYDVGHGEFKTVRMCIDETHRPQFDRVVGQILAEEEA